VEGNGKGELNAGKDLDVYKKNGWQGDIRTPFCSTHQSCSPAIFPCKDAEKDKLPSTHGFAVDDIALILREA